MPTWNPTSSGPESNRRRSQRVILSIGITVCNEGGDPNTAFEEQTQTLVVNAHGALIALTAKVEKDQRLRLKNRLTRAEQVCKVIYSGAAVGDKLQIGVEFTSLAPDFWGIAFPPEDWNVPRPPVQPASPQPPKK
jgi:hypothetical protein